MSNNNNSSSSIALSHLALRPSSLQLLSSRGFSTLAEVQASKQDGGLANLAAELGVSLAVAGGIWRELQQTNNPQSSVVATTKPQTAHSLLTSQNSTSTSTTTPIITFCRDIDQLLQGGIALGELTEIAGEPGAGKTQWGMQLAVDVSLPTWAGGVNGECIYIDTEGSFGPERVQLLAHALVQHLQTGLQRRKQRAKENAINNNNHTASTSTNSNTNKYPWEDVEYTTTAQDILQGIHVIRVHDLAELQATLEGTVPELCRQRTDSNKPIKLLVVDSLAFPIRAAPPPSMDPQLQNRTPDTFHSKHPDDAQFYVARTRQLTLLAQQLSQLAVTFQLAAVAMNQMTTKMTKSGTTAAAMSSSSHLVPALGESWAHAVTTRLILSSSSPQQQQQQRTCALVKSPRLASGMAHYQILDCGVRAMDHCSSGRGSRPWSSGSNSSLDDTYHSEPKRSRMSTDD